MHPIKHLFTDIFSALRRMLLPGVILWLIGLLLYLSYLYFEPGRQFWASLADLKVRYGYWYSAIATALLSGMVPFLILLLMKIEKSQNFIFNIFVLSLFWAWRGSEVDLLYRLQGQWFGYQNNFSTIATKVAVDQFLYSTFIAAPIMAGFYLLKNNNYRFRSFRHDLNRHFFLHTLPKTIVGNWMIWIPAVSIIYAFPKDLQLPFCNLIACFWTLLLNLLSAKKVESTAFHVVVD